MKPDIVLIDGIPLTASSYKKLLGITIDSELKFENHIAKLFVKFVFLQYIKLHVNRKQSITLIRVSMESMMWMLHSSTMHKKNYKRAMRAPDSGYKSFFIDFLHLDVSFRIHQKISKIQPLKFVSTLMAISSNIKWSFSRSMKNTI